MRIVSLTTIPPRFADLGPGLDSLLTQRPAADHVVLAVPERYSRFPDAHTPPDVHKGVTLLPCQDLGPATKVIAPRAAFPKAQIIYCDDDCHYGPGWLSALCDSPGPVAAASTFEGTRVGLPGITVVQGFAGVRIDPHVPLPTCVPKPVLFADDLFLSAWLAHHGIPVTPCPTARQSVTPCSLADGLQDQARPDAYRQAAKWLRENLVF